MNLASVWSDFNEKLKPFGSTVSKQFTQVQQLAREKMGAASAGDVTELPAEYREMEEKVDNIKAMHELFLRVARTYTVPHNDYEPPLQDSVFDFASSVQENVKGFAAAGAQLAGVSGSKESLHSPNKENIPKSLSHALSKCALDSVELVGGTNEPVGVALGKFAAVHERVGNAKLRMDEEISAKFYSSCLYTLNHTIGQAMKARKNVYAVRLNYDAARARLKNARPEKMEQFRVEMEAAEDEFVAAVDDAMGKMKTVVENVETLKNLNDLVNAQFEYYKESYEALAQLKAEMDEIVRK